MSKVFLSYSRKSQEMARILVDDIQNLGYVVWFDRELSGGHAWWDQILANIRSSDVFVFVLDPDGLNSTACQREFRYAAALGKPVLPVLVADGVSTNLLPPELSRLHFIDCRNQDRKSALALAKALFTAPPPGALPDPLPTPPELPVSHLGALGRKIETAVVLSYEEQSAIVLDLRRGLRDRKLAGDTRVLLAKMRARRDVFAVIAEEIDDLSGSPVAVEPPQTAGAPRMKVNPKDGLTYVWIPPGAFTMGCSPGDSECRSNEKPAHQVTITRGFWIGQTPVTQEAYERVTGKNPSKFKGPTLPVENVNWNEAQSYCQAVGMRLPTEAEWEYAARAGTTGSRYGDLDQISWYTANSGGKTHEVRQKQPNAWGLYDMLGNVWEWTADRYADKYPGNAETDPQGPASESSRVLRGGSWSSNPANLRASGRVGFEPEVRVDFIGLRCLGN